MKKPIVFILLMVWLAGGLSPIWAGDKVLPVQVTSLNDSLKNMYAPDKRVAIFDVDYTMADNTILLRGFTSVNQAKQKLISGLQDKGYHIVDALKVLPDQEALGDKIYGVVNISVCNLRVDPDFSAEMTSQALMGMPVQVFQKDSWYQVQTPDDYIAWVHPTGIHRMNLSELQAWNQSEKVVITTPFGLVYSQPDVRSQSISDIVAGDRLKLLNRKGKFFKVEYPDGKQGYVKTSDGEPLSAWRKKLDQNAEGIIRTAKTMLGFPYLWAGTSVKGIDCSGFVRTALYLNDIIIPRDASQQAYVGQHIEIADNFSNLLPGDLVFFGRKAANGKKEHVSHVGIYIGNKQFIHSQGDVRISSFDPQSVLYDPYNLNRMLHAVRFLPYINKEKGLTTTDTNSYFIK